MWAASCLCLFGVLQAGEMTVLRNGGYDLQMHLYLSDIALDDNRRHSLALVSIKQSKTDPFRQWVDTFVGRTATDLCPASALLDYLKIRVFAPAPLLIFEDGWLLTQQHFVDGVHDGLEKAGVDQSKFCGQFQNKRRHYSGLQRSGGLRH